VNDEKVIASWRAVGGLLATLSEAFAGQRYLAIGPETGPSRRRWPVWTLSPVEAAQRPPDDHVVLIHFAGKQRHPLGEQAQISWYNDEGEGLILHHGNGIGVIAMPLRGHQEVEHLPFAARRENDGRGPIRLVELWVLLTALCWPRTPLKIERFQMITGVSLVSLRPAMRRLVDHGFLSRRRAQDGRTYLYRAVFETPEYLEEYVHYLWSAWRGGDGAAGFKAIRRYFYTQLPWRAMDTSSEPWRDVWPTGLTFMEGGPKALDAPLVTGGTSIPTLDLYAIGNDIAEVGQALGLQLSRKREPDMQGSLCLIDADHPVARIYLAREDYGIRWPSGFAAMDAMDHDDARVRQEARKLWRDWISNQRREYEKG